MTIRMISPTGHPGDIHPGEVEHMRGHGWVTVEDEDDGEPASDCLMTDDELRAAIKGATGKAPHHKTGRSKLIEAYEATKAAA